MMSDKAWLALTIASVIAFLPLSWWLWGVLIRHHAAAVVCP